MKIEIDTSRDSANDIQKAISLLQSLVMAHSNLPMTTTRGLLDSQDSNNAFATLFDNHEKKEKPVSGVEFY